MKDNVINKILEKAEKHHQLTLKEIKNLLEAEGQEKELLFKTADRVRENYLGNTVHLRAIIEFSNHCKNNCFYCGLRRDNKKIKRYRLTEEEIINNAAAAVKLGYRTVVLQSGEDTYFNRDRLAAIIREIKKLDTAVTLSVGEHSYRDYEAWREAGADRYLLRHETADPDIYHRLHPGMSWKERIQRLQWLRELGYQVGSGNIIGLPGQDLESIARDILLFKELDLHMVGLGPLVVHPDTPLKGMNNGSVELTLKTIAITRLLLPLAHIPGTTALGTLSSRGRERALKAGANVVMPNVTSRDYRFLYEIYPDKICLKEEPVEYRSLIVEKIKSLGLRVGQDYGHSPKLKKSSSHS